MNNRARPLVIWGVLLVVFGMALRVLKAEPQITSSIGSDVVTVSCADGTVYRGSIAAYDVDGLTIKPVPKPPAKAYGKPKKDAPPPVAPVDPEPVTLAWHDVKHVSDGLTQRKALDAWEAAHRADLCPTCLGERTVWCPTCKGTAHDPAAAVGCKTCGGELLVDCKTSRCEKGQIPCMNGCLQLGVGGWIKHPDGLMWRKFAFSGGGSSTYSEHHVGHVILYDYRLKRADDVGTCPICGGTTKVNDPVCHGTGKMPCPTCLARTNAGPCPDKCDNGRVVCPTCGGTGLKKA